MKQSRGVTTIGRLNVTVGVIYILRIPLIVLMLSGLRGAFLRVLEIVYIIVGNLHWGDNIGILKALFVDTFLAAVLISSGLLTLRRHPRGRVLAFVYAGLSLALEFLGFAEITRDQLRSAAEYAPGAATAAITSFVAKLIYPIVLLVFYSLPQVRREFQPGRSDETTGRDSGETGL
ncbi:MAG: hypothetical protein ACT4PY_03390 [Armatimonadota bacterium]